MQFVDEKIQKHSLLEIFLFMYVMYPFAIGPVYIPTKLGYYGFVLFSIFKFCLSFTHSSIKKKDFSLIRGFISAFSICIFISLVYPIMKNTWDFSFFEHFINYLILYICSILLFNLSDNMYDFIALFLKANSFYVICSLVLLIPNVRVSYQDFSGITISDALMDSWQMKSGLYYTRFGLQGFSGFAHTFRCSFAFALGCWLLSFLKNKKVKFLVALNMVINFIGCCLYGRVGILASLLVFTIYSLFCIIKYKKYKLLVSILLLIFIVCFNFIYFFDSLKEIPFVKFAFEPFINLIEKGAFETASSDGLKTHWRVPSLKTVALGDAKYTEDGHYYTRVDVGLIRPLLFWGLLGSFIYYWMVIFLVISISSKQKENGFILGCIIICLMLFYEIKGECVPDMIQILIPMSLVLHKYKFKSIHLGKEVKKYFFGISCYEK